MIKSAINISLVPEMQGTPHIPGTDLEQICKWVSEIGFDGIEIFPRNGKDINRTMLKELLQKYNLKLCVFGSGAGKALQQLTFTNPDPDMRKRAVEFIADIIDAAAEFGSQLMVGSMQDSARNGVSREQAIEWLIECLNQMAKIAMKENVTLVLEPINRYETNLINTLQQGVEIIKLLDYKNVQLVADLFHMNIEESSISDSIIDAGEQIGHFHFVDSNRKAPGFGHINFQEVGSAVKHINYKGYFSVEALPVPDIQTVLKQSMGVFKNSIK